ncbi:MAG: ABC transporter permease [Candidatus Verstraetearchaeota archaeon]|nr:ABC transporter permease [Candidatus Verstraetearchaeota archaeon]
MIEWAILVGVAAATLRVAAPLILASLGETVVEKAGLLNLGLQGAMLVGAFSGFMGAFFTGSLWLGLVCCVIGGTITTLLYGVLVINLNLDQVVSGLAINLLAGGLTLYFTRALFTGGVAPYLQELFGPMQIPLLGSIPILGEIIFSHTGFVYFGLICVPLISILLTKTTFGLRLRSIGEDPVIASYLGIDVVKMRYVALFIEGILAGIAGGLLTISMFNTFDTRIVAARGFVAVSIVILGRWNPLGVLAGSLLFGFTEVLSLRIGILFPEISSASTNQLFALLPYLVALIALIVGGRRVRGPASLGKRVGRE